MEQKKAVTLARKLMNQHGLDTLTLKISSSKRTLGTYQYRTSARGVHEPVQIKLSKYWLKILDEDQVRDTVLHEIAHALTPDHGHDHVWQQMARKLGVSPSRTAHDVPVEVQKRLRQSVAKYVAICETDPSHRYYFNRMGKLWSAGAYRCHCGGRYHVSHNSSG